MTGARGVATTGARGVAMTGAPRMAAPGDVAVVGAGIGGLAAALAFARAGCDVTVHERASAFAEVGAGIQISPNGFAVLHALGLGDAVAARGRRSEAIEVSDALDGGRLLRMALRGRPFFLLHRADLVTILAEACAAAGVGFRFGTALRAPPEADLVVGADGVHSAMRERLNGGSDARFSGQVAWRALVDASLPDLAQIFVAPGRHLVTYPLRDGKIANLVAVEERDRWHADGWHHAGDPEGLRRAFADCAAPVRDLVARVRDVHVWGLHLRPMAGVWTGDGVAIVGDAAHPTLPFLAQGANLALEDAWVLADCAMAGRLGAYASRRTQRVRRALAAAEANARNYHLRGVRRRAAHLALRVLDRTAPGLMLGRYRWLYENDVTKGGSGGA